MPASTFKIPDHYLGADLFWWQERPDLHTLITIRGDVNNTNCLRPPGLSKVILTFALFDVDGVFQASWQETVTSQGTIFLDSRNHPVAAKRQVSEGVLAVFVSSVIAPSEEIKRQYHRLYSLIDWYSLDGEIVSLHNDQSLQARSRELDFTEIVFCETAEAQTYLVIVNGNEAQPPNSVQLRIKNLDGEERSSCYQPPMAPFSLHKLYLNQLFDELVDYCGGHHATLSGHFQARGMYLRPYVMTQGKWLSGYHGGDLYQWRGVSHLTYKALGRGEVNPMVAIHNHELVTAINLLHSHGDIEDDYWVDARLYDEQGQLVAEREHWLQARRNQLSRAEISDLLPNPDRPFTGHIALNFSPTSKAWYPRRLQALMEYRTRQGTARVMAWSDIWNGGDRIRTLRNQLDPRLAQLVDMRLSVKPIVYHCYYRVWAKYPLESSLSITNCGVTPDYSQSVNYRIRLENGHGEHLVYEGKLAPQATDFGPVSKFFPSVEDFLSGQPVALAKVESEADLAVMHFTRHLVSGVYGAEHFMAEATFSDGEYYYPCGS